LEGIVRRYVRGVIAVALMAAAGVLLTPGTAQAATTTGWARWGALSGSSNNFETTMQLPGLGFPEAAVATDSRSPVQIPSGASTFLGGTTDSVPTPVGAKYGSSRGQPYLNLRPEADTAATPSTTTYTFDTATPSSGWAFVLGDVDADAVQISAKDASGAPVGAATIDDWFRGVFNYAGASDLPTWSAGDSTLTGNAGAADTNGASAWFEPTVSLSTLTFVFTRRAGFPVYQTWFADLARSITGTVSDVSTAGGTCPVADTTVELVGPSGQTLATVHPDASGNYSFGQVATQAGYTVRMQPPTQCAVVGPEEQTVDTTSADASADFQVRQILPQAVSGRVTSVDGSPVPGATVTLTPPSGPARTITTDENGDYLIDNNASGSGYTVSVTPPAGYTVSGPASHTFDIATDPITGQDFTLAQLPAVSGTVTGGGGPLDGVTVTLTPAGGGAPVSTVTHDGGSYEFADVQAGDYQISVTPPSGYHSAAPRDVTVSSADVDGQDFALDRPGALGGQVTDTGKAAVAGATVTVDGPGGTHTLTTDADGNYFLDDLAPGSYTITLTVPSGYRAATTTRTVTITAAGEIRGGQDFRVSKIVASTSPSSTPTSSAGTSPNGGGSEPIANTGAGIKVPLASGLALLVLGALALLAARPGSHRRR